MRISIMVMAFLFGLLPMAFGEYILDVVYPDDDRPLSLHLGTNNAATKDYDAFLTFPSGYKGKELCEWDKLGLGRFVQASVSNQAGCVSLTINLKQYDLTGWEPVKDTPWRCPNLRSMHIETIVQVRLGVWTIYGETEGIFKAVKFRVRDSATQPTYTPYSSPVLGTNRCLEPLKHDPR